MYQKIYDSSDVVVMADYIWKCWHEFSEDKRPKDKNDPVIWRMANDHMNDDYEQVVSDFTYNAPDSHIILYGHVGLWNGRPAAYKVTTPSKCFDIKCDNIEIAYEDGEIIVNAIHHDGTDVLEVRQLKDESELDTDGDKEFRLDLIEGSIFLKDEDMHRVRRITRSVAEYFREYLSEVAEEDLDSILEKRRLEELRRRNIQFNYYIREIRTLHGTILAKTKEEAEAEIFRQWAEGIISLDFVKPLDDVVIECTESSDVLPVLERWDDESEDDSEDD